MSMKREFISNTTMTNARKFVGKEIIVSAPKLHALNSQIIDNHLKSLDSLTDKVKRAISDSTGSIIRDDSAKLIPSLSFVPTTKPGSDKNVTTAIPEMESVSLKFDKSKGIIDGFYASISILIHEDAVRDGSAKVLRVFRSDDSLSLDTNLSMIGLERISDSRIRTRIKGSEKIEHLEKRLEEVGVKNSLSTLSPFDSLSGARTGKTIGSMVSHPSGSSEMVPATSAVASDLISYLDPAGVENIDRSVANDPKSLRNMQLSKNDPDFSFEKKNVISGTGRARSQGKFIVQQNNFESFKEIRFTSLQMAKGNIVGEFMQFEFDDPTISYGKRYSYYATIIDKNMKEGLRSKIVSLDVQMIRTPERPRRVFVTIMKNSISLSISVDDKFIEKFEIYRYCQQDAERSFEFNSILGASGFAIEKQTSKTIDNGFILIGESLNSTVSNGSHFIDRNVIPGRNYVYRVYSVDIFGNKSESPVEVKASLILATNPHNAFAAPTISVDIDSATKKIKVSFSCQDDKIKTLILKRKDVGNKEQEFIKPGDVATLKLGFGNSVGGQKKFEGERLFDQVAAKNWQIMFRNDGSTLEFIDKLSKVDGTYRYQVHGVDRFGNVTSTVTSKPIMLLDRQMIQSPIDLSMKVSGSGATLSWRNGSLDISSEERLGDRNKLSGSIIRTLYQVERRAPFTNRWEEFPLTEQTSLVDKVGKEEAPSFRPSYLSSNIQYVYRVRAMQSGTFLSNFSNELRVTVSSPMLRPTSFHTKPSDANVRPLMTFISWDTLEGSGVVDSWTIEKCSINSVKASDVDVGDASTIAKLNFESFRNVFRESSRSKSASIDKKNNVSMHAYVDTDVQLGNTYVYRIRANGIDGSHSEWAYSGVKHSSDAFEKKMKSVITSEEMMNLIKSDGLLDSSNLSKSKGQKDSFSVVPSFASPDKLSKIRVGK